MNRIRRQFISRRWNKYGLTLDDGVWVSKNEDPFRSAAAHNLVVRYCEQHPDSIDLPLRYFSVLEKSERLYLGGRRLGDVWIRKLRYF